MAKTAIITGGNSGIGAETAKALAAKGYRVAIACRNQEKAEAVKAEIVRLTPGAQVDLCRLDLGSMKSVREFADRVYRDYDRLDVLVNNAGLSPIRKTMTEDGFEQQFQVNYLGHYLLTRLLDEKLKKSSPSRIVHVSSMMHRLGSINWDSFRGEKFYFSLSAYGQSKLANILFSNELARRWVKAGVVSNALHPGAVETDIYHEIPKPVYALIRRTLISAEKGADTVIWLASAPETATVNGKYFINRREKETSAKAKDTELAARLWDESAKLCGLPA